jgi:hypothetical protein
MAKLEDKQMDMLKLIGRSPPDSEGWRKVSAQCCVLFEKEDILPPAELYAFERTENGGRVRMTERGETLLAYS